MTEYLESLSENLADHEIYAESLDRKELSEFQRSWLDTFVCRDATQIEQALSVLRGRGMKPVAEKIGKGFVVGVEGALAEEMYLQLPPAEFIFWEPYSKTGFHCQIGKSMPMFGSMPCGFRSTITAVDLKWTATFPGLCCAGKAFFALSDWQPVK